MRRGRYYKTEDGLEPEKFLLNLWAKEGTRLQTKEIIALTRKNNLKILTKPVADETIIRWIQSLEKKKFLIKEYEGRKTFYTINQSGRNRAYKSSLIRIVEEYNLFERMIDEPCSVIFSDVNLDNLIDEKSLELVEEKLESVTEAFFDLESTIYDLIGTKVEKPPNLYLGLFNPYLADTIFEDSDFLVPTGSDFVMKSVDEILNKLDLNQKRMYKKSLESYFYFNRNTDDYNIPKWPGDENDCPNIPNEKIESFYKKIFNKVQIAIIVKKSEERVSSRNRRTLQV